ncbi:DNA-binding protein HU [Candidatus Cerribacteria bacterium 'Amazon FNV 2010 28 9']|uniref:DNA-binding protein HU n=1 Tax=Candidatus Cerribacteria bacterium 'Amazon FNV 2010 28 9' TaxID=2081795 RepID=A0A317JQ29_9BACT|nr:MAG: DNA-binding protein HU [Candidatus Cerribacteria bacterium 'Amazon FNV 2010 28 9']
MTQSDLVDIVAMRAHMPKRAANDAIEVFLEEVTRALSKGDKVVLSGFGTFSIGKVKDKQVVPFGDETKRKTIKGHKVVNFKVGKPFKKIVW